MLVKTYICLIIVLCLTEACSNTSHRKNSTYTSTTTQTGSNSIPVGYLSYATDGFVKKYFDKNWNIVHYEYQSYYYREAYYKNGCILQDSVTRDYYSNGALQFEGHLKSEFPDVIDYGTWYYSNGTISQIIAAAEANGKAKIKRFYENGKIQSLYSVKDDALSGKYTRYYDNGVIEFVYNYVNGVRDGKAIEYHKNGKVAATCSYKNGKGNGPLTVYYENGNVKVQAYCKNDSYEGVMKIYYQSGKIKEIRNYTNNECNGDYKTFYENGRVESYGIAINGKKAGIWEYHNIYGNVSFQNHSASTTYNYGRSYYRNDYDDLWDECEDMESVLNDAGIDHEDLSSSMDYDDLENLRDEYQNLLDENNINY